MAAVSLFSGANDGYLIRHNGQLIHSDPSAYMLTHHEIDVSVGDHLEVAQWQYIGGWLWDVRFGQSENTLVTPTDVLLTYLDTVQKSLYQPNGPPLKMYSHGRTPIRTVVSLYNMILNDYIPSEVLLFGENQWDGQARELFAATFPFANVIPTPQASISSSL
jgi:hypothetical protein